MPPASSGFVCDKCEATVRQKYNPAIFDDGRYARSGEGGSVDRPWTQANDNAQASSTCGHDINAFARVTSASIPTSRAPSASEMDPGAGGAVRPQSVIHGRSTCGARQIRATATPMMLGTLPNPTMSVGASAHHALRQRLRLGDASITAPDFAAAAEELAYDMRTIVNAPFCACPTAIPGSGSRNHCSPDSRVNVHAPSSERSDARRILLEHQRNSDLQRFIRSQGDARRGDACSWHGL
jgi:hypothetical protein